MDADYTAAKGYLRGERYYGRIVRKFFLFGGIVMLVSLPFFGDFVPGNPMISLVALVGISLAAGFLNPVMRSAVVFDVLVSIVAMVIFEYEALSLYSTAAGFRGQLFLAVNQILALNFFLATYYGAKSVRGLFIKAKIVNSD